MAGRLKKPINRNAFLNRRKRKNRFLAMVNLFFLVADTQLYKRLCPSVGPLVRPSVMVIESKSGKTSVLDTFCVCLCVEGVWVGVWMGFGCGWG